MDRIAVIVPARNEERLLGGALRALGAAADRVAPTVRTSVVVVANGCTDRTVEVATAVGATVIETGGPNVGAARAAGFAHAIGLTGGRTDRLWLATTDADSRVAPEWLRSQLVGAARGTDLYLGTVTLEPEQRARFSTWLARYRAAYEGDDRHGHVHGASMGMRAEAYLAAGGFRALDHSEDVDLVDRLVAGGARVAWDASCPVTTSARLDARAPAGVASDLVRSLQEWDEVV